MTLYDEALAEYSQLKARMQEFPPKWLSSQSGVKVERIYQLRRPSNTYCFSWPEFQALKSAIDGHRATK